MQSLKYPITTHQITLFNNCKVSYTDTGKGRYTIVMIHGLATYALSWIKNIEALSKHHRCIAIDLPGHGLSDPLPTNYSLHHFAESLIDLIGRLKLSNVVLAGHSMGAQVAIHALLQVPQIAQKLILCAPAGFEKFTSTEVMLYKNGLQYADLFGDDQHHLKHLLQHSFSHFPKDASNLQKDLLSLQKHAQKNEYRRMIKQCVSAMLDEPVYNKLPGLPHPTLIIYGEEDRLIPNRLIHNLSTSKLALHIQKRMQNATLKLIPKAGHFVQWEKSAVVNELIEDFLK